MKKFYIILVIFCSVLGQISAKITLPNFGVISNIDGLPSDVITSIDQDSRGYIWIGTDSGLARYDGYNIKCYDDISIPNNEFRRRNVRHLFVDSDDVVWVGTEDGLYLINSRSEEIERFPSDIFNNNTILYIYEDGEHMWIATFQKLYRYNKSSEEIVAYVSSADGLTNNRIRHIQRDRSGNIWLLNLNNGAVIYDKSGDRFVQLTPKFGSATLTLTSLYFDGDKTYVTTWEHGVYEVRYDEGYKNVEFIQCDFLQNDSTISIIKDDLYNYYWISSINGVYVTDSLVEPTMIELIQSDTTTATLSNKEIRCTLYMPREMILWFGTVGGGVNQLSLGEPIIKNIRLNDFVEHISSNNVTSIFNYRDELWFGVRYSVMLYQDKNSGELHKFSEHPWLSKIHQKADGINCITRVMHRNEIWLGSRYNGVWIVELDDDGDIVDVDNLKKFAPKVIFNNEINKIFADSKGQVFISTKDKRLTLYTERGDDGSMVETLLSQSGEVEGSNHMPSHRILDIAEGDDGEIFFATESSGVWRCINAESEDRYFERVDVLFGAMQINETNSIYRDSELNLWLATNNDGLARYNVDKGVFEVEQRFVDMDIKSINSIIEDRNGDLWFGSNKGVVWVNRARDIVTIFSRTDGLSDNIYTINSVAKDDHGRLFYGGFNGYSMIDLNTIRDNDLVSKPAITDISILNRSILHRASINNSRVERSDDGDVKILHLESGDVNFAIEFSSLLMQNPGKNNFEYRLKGYDKEFRQAVNGAHVASYSNLSSGRYTFEVYALNNSGVRSTDSALMDIYVHPEWYNTWWAWLIWIGIIVSVVGLVVNYIVMRVRFQNSLKIARIELAKTEELNTAKLQFFANVSHELLTPLTIISCGLENLRLCNYQHDKLYEVIKGNVTRLMNLTEQILEFRKADSGNLKLQVGYDDLRELILRIAEDDFRMLIQKKSLSMEITCQSEPIYGYFDKDKLSKIICNLLSNAYKYNIEGGEIRVNIEGLDVNEEDLYARVKIEVSNTGNVITEEQQKSLFMRFYDGAYRQFNTKGVGIGLSLTKDLVELHQGEISVDSSYERGTTFTITLPLGREVYKDVVEPDLVPRVVDRLEVASEDQIEIMSEESRCTILLVEDDVDCQFVIETFLSGRYDVIVAQDGREALTLALAHNPDIIVSDVIMPNMDGYEMCATVKQDVNLSHIPVILLTAKIASKSKIEGLDSGAEAYLTKPIELDLLVAQIESLLKSRQMLAQRFQKGGVAMSTDAKYISINEKFLEQAIDVIQDNISNVEFDCVDFQSALNVTKSTLYRKLKVLTNMSPNEFMRHVRLQRARDLLLQKGDTIYISEVSYATGFNSPRYFTNCFKKKYGVTPTQFLESQMEGLPAD
ncbi:MAG: two-component regulator propeller domain-containing protein [Rikenellaceae bacterium]